MRYYRYLMMVILVWMIVCGTVVSNKITHGKKTTTTTATTSSSGKKGNVWQRIGSYMFRTVDKIVHPILPYYQRMTRVIHSMHPMEFQMYLISLRAVNLTKAPTPAPSKNPSSTSAPSSPYPSYSPSIVVATSSAPSFPAPTLAPAQVIKFLRYYCFTTDK